MLLKVEQIVNQLCEFIAYVDSFYNEKNGIYPIKGLTNSMIINATQKYITSQTKDYTWGNGDSVDLSLIHISEPTRPY